MFAGLYNGTLTADMEKLAATTACYTPSISIIIDATELEKGYQEQYVPGMGKIPQILAAKAVEAAFAKNPSAAAKGEQIARNGTGRHGLFGFVKGIKASKYAEGLETMSSGAKAYLDKALEGANKMFIATVQEQLHGGMALIHRDLTKNEVESYSVSVVLDKEKAKALREKLEGATAMAAVPLVDGGLYYLPIGGKISDFKTARILRLIVEASETKPVTRELALAIEQSVLNPVAIADGTTPHKAKAQAVAGGEAGTHDSVLGAVTNWFTAKPGPKVPTQEVTKRPTAKTP